MIRSLLTGVTLALWAGLLSAQELPVRSGNHSTFTRLTLPVQVAQTWQARRTEAGVEITLPAHVGGFDTVEVFSRIPTDRITTVTADKTTLSIGFECNCSATAFRSGDLLVIDVAATGTPLFGTPIIADPAPEPTISASGSTTPEPISLASPAEIGGRILPWIGAQSPFEGVAVPTIPNVAEPRSTPGQPFDENTAARSALLREVQKNLSSEVASATNRGLLEHSYGAPPSAAVESSAEASPVPVPRPLPDALEIPSQNLRISSSMDLPPGLSTGETRSTAAGITCPEDSFLEVETWGNDSPFSAQIGSAREKLFDVRDKLDSEEATDLAQLYIYFGFGAEALDVLRLDSDLMRKNAHLANIATIMERGDLSGHPNAIGAYADCSSDIALWATLSFADLPADVQIDSKATLRALNKLPKHLRHFIAPALSDRLLQYGDRQSAATALRSVERLPDAPSPDTIMAQAQLVMDAGESANDILEEVIETNSTQSPEALVQLVEATLAKNQPLSYETATLVEAFAQELRGTEIGNELRKTQVVALSQSGHFNEAFTALDALLPSISPTKGKELRERVLEHMAQVAEDVNFLEHLFEQEPDDIKALGTSVKLKLAGRLMDLGFASQVQRILADIPESPLNEARQLLTAEAAIMLRRPFQAQAALIGIESPEAALLLARAKAMTGAYREAAEIFASQDAREEAVQAAWLADEWRDLTAPDTPGLGIIATLSAGNGIDVDPSLGPLGRADAALEESRAARDALSQMLRNPTVQIDPEFTAKP